MKTKKYSPVTMGAFGLLVVLGIATFFVSLYQVMYEAMDVKTGFMMFGLSIFTIGFPFAMLNEGTKKQYGPLLFSLLGAGMMVYSFYLVMQ